MLILVLMWMLLLCVFVVLLCLLMWKHILLFTLLEHNVCNFSGSFHIKWTTFRFFSSLSKSSTRSVRKRKNSSTIFFEATICSTHNSSAPKMVRHFIYWTILLFSIIVWCICCYFESLCEAASLRSNNIAGVYLMLTSYSHHNTPHITYTLVLISPHSGRRAQCLEWPEPHRWVGEKHHLQGKQKTRGRWTQCQGVRMFWGCFVLFAFVAVSNVCQFFLFCWLWVYVFITLVSCKQSPYFVSFRNLLSPCHHTLL